MSRLVATFLGAGLLRPAPGTWGSLAAIPAAWGLVNLGGWIVLALGAVLAFLLGLWATAEETRGKEDHDPSEIVIDEVAGQWIALLPVAFGATHAGVGFWALWPGVLTAFVAFRLFDITKPGPIGWADGLHSPLGVMLDDVIAGIFAALTVVGFAYLFHGSI